MSGYPDRRSHVDHISSFQEAYTLTPEKLFRLRAVAVGGLLHWRVFKDGPRGGKILYASQMITRTGTDSFEIKQLK